MKTKEPYQYNNRILVVVIGKTPQIVTETLYKLCTTGEHPFIPTEVHIITTIEGAESAKLALLGIDAEGGWFHTFCEDFGFHDIQFSTYNIHVIGDTEGQFISDAESSRHNQMAADFITSTIRDFASDEQAALHVSLAGGRKTMSYYAGYGLSLYGRFQDRLSHVLVNNPFNNNPEFYYPRPNPQRLLINGKYHSTNEARITLSDIPFVRMRYQLPEELLSGAVKFHEAVDIIQNFTDAETLELNLEDRKVILNGGLSLKIDPIDTALLYWFCTRALNQEGPLYPDEDAFMQDFLKHYGQIVGYNSGNYARVEENSENQSIEDQIDWLWRRNSKLNNKIKAKLGKKLARPFLIEKTSRDARRSGYELTLEPDQITIHK